MLLRVIFPVIMLLLSSASYALSYNMEFTEAELQDKVSAMMPLQKEKYFFTVIFSDPVVELLETDNRIGIMANIMVSAPGGIEAKGKAHITGSLRYDNKKAEFYLDNPVLNEFELDKLPEKHLPTVKKIAQSALEKAAAKKPVYKLKDASVKQKLAKSLLKSVKVKNKKIFVELSPFGK